MGDEFADLIKQIQGGEQGAAGVNVDNTILSFNSKLKIDQGNAASAVQAVPGAAAPMQQGIAQEAAALQQNQAGQAQAGANVVVVQAPGTPTVTADQAASATATAGPAVITVVAAGGQMSGLGVAPQAGPTGGASRKNQNDNSADPSMTIVASLALPQTVQLTTTTITSGGTSSAPSGGPLLVDPIGSPAAAAAGTPAGPSLEVIPVTLPSAASQNAPTTLAGAALDAAAAAQAAVNTAASTQAAYNGPKFVAMLAVEEDANGQPTIEALAVTISQQDNPVIPNLIATTPQGASAQALALQKMGVNNAQISVSSSDDQESDVTSTPVATSTDAVPDLDALWLADMGSSGAATTTPGSSGVDTSSNANDNSSEAVLAAAAAIAQQVAALFSNPANAIATFADNAAASAALTSIDAAGAATTTAQLAAPTPAQAGGPGTAPAFPMTPPGQNPNAPQTSGATAQTNEAQGTQTANRAGIAAPIEQIKVMVEKGLNGASDTVKVELSPENMGKIEVKIEQQDGQTKVTVTAERASTLQVLKADAPALLQSLKQAGLNADASSISFYLRGEQQQRQANGQQQGQSNGSQRRGVQPIDALDGLDDTSSAPTASADDALDISV